MEFACSAESKQEPDHKKYKCFELQNFGGEEFRQFFRFTKTDVQILCDKLAIPPIMESVTRHKWSGLEGLCLVLRRLAYPNHLCDLIPLFGRSLTDLSIVFNETLQFIHTRHKHHVSSLTQPWIDHAALAKAVFDKGACLSNVYGFIDGTIQRMCRPQEGQEELFSGHKRYHGMKYQHVMLPNGLILHCYGPFDSRRHDAAMYNQSGLDEELQAIKVNGVQMALYGDGGVWQQRLADDPFPKCNRCRGTGIQCNDESCQGIR